MELNKNFITLIKDKEALEEEVRKLKNKSEWILAEMISFWYMWKLDYFGKSYLLLY